MRIVLPPAEPQSGSWTDRLPALSGRTIVAFVAVALVAFVLVPSRWQPHPAGQPAAYLPLATPQPGPADWPGWRGPTQQGQTTDGLPLSWSLGEQSGWKTPLPGVTRSGPCVWGNDVFVAVVQPGRRTTTLAAFDLFTGRERFRTILGQGDASTEPTATPLCDGEKVFLPIAEDGHIRLCAVNRDGRPCWKVDVASWANRHSWLSSPALDGALVFMAVEQTERWGFRSVLRAFHRQTGKLAWQTSRPGGDSFGVPIVAEIAGRRQLVLAGKGTVTSYDPATGGTLWTCRWSATRTAGSVAYDADHVYATSTVPEPETICVRADGAGDVTDSHLVWRERRTAADGPSPTFADFALLLLSQQGELTALDHATGALLWRQLLPGEFDASPIVARHHLYCTNRDGVVCVIDLRRRGEVIARHSLGESAASPLAVAGHRLLWCSERQLNLVAPAVTNVLTSQPAASRRKL